MSEKPKRNRARRGRGEGSVYQQADGRWAGRLSLGRDASGKRKRRVVYGRTKAEAMEELRKLNNRKAAGMLDDAGRTTVAQYLADWLESSAKPTIRASTFDSYSEIVRLHLDTHIGGVILAKLAPAHVRGMLAAMQAAGLSPRRQQYARAVLRRSLKMAVQDGMIARNVCDAVPSPRVPKHEITPFDQDQAAEFLTAVENDPLKAMFVLAIASGMRLGEILGLQWDAVDLKAGRVSVRRSLRWKRKEFILDEPKTAKGRRMIELPGVAVEALQEHRVAALAGGRMSFPWVFCDADGTPFDRNRVRHAFDRLVKAAGLPAVRLHDLRHTCASLMLALGENPKVVQERLGHSTISLTMDTYSHVLPGLQREAANRLDSALRKNGHQLATKTGSVAAGG